MCVYVCVLPYSMGKKVAEPKGRKVTLKMAQAAVKLTVDGRRRLDLSNMGIATFPKCLLQLSDVEELDLSRNLLRKLPETLDTFANLRWLDLHSNQLESLPHAVGRLQALCTLNLSNNRLSPAGLPPELGLLAGLRSLNLGLNRLDAVPHFLSALRELRELGLFSNRLGHDPAILRLLPKLEKVNMADNPLPPASPPPLDAIRRVEGLYLVPGDCLCRLCHQRCQQERERLDSRASGKTPNQRRPLFTGLLLLSPNSVARQDQEIGR